MVYGGIHCDQLQFNDKSVWTGTSNRCGSYQNFGDLFIEDISGAFEPDVTTDGEDRISFPTTAGGRYTIDLSGNSGISPIAASATADSEEYFDLQGRRVAADSIAAGIYIRRSGSVAEKVVLR